MLVHRGTTCPVPCCAADHTQQRCATSAALRLHVWSHGWAPLGRACPHQASGLRQHGWRPRWRHPRVHASGAEDWADAWSADPQQDTGGTTGAAAAAGGVEDPGPVSRRMQAAARLPQPRTPPSRPLGPPDASSGGYSTPATPAMQPSPMLPPTDQHFAAFRAFQQLAALQPGPPATSPRQQPRPAGSPGTDGPGTRRGQYFWPSGQGVAGGQGWDPGSRPAVPGRSARRDAARAAEAAPPSQLPDRGGGSGENRPASRLARFRSMTHPALQTGWYAKHSYSVESLRNHILRLCTHKNPGAAPLFHLLRLASCQEHMRSALSACVAVREARAQHSQQLGPVGGPQFAAAFVQACVRCDAPDVLGEALLRANEAGLELSYAAVHEALRHWACRHELFKVERVLEAMPAGGLPYTTKTAYIVIRGAVNAGRQDDAEALAAMFEAAGVRLHDTTRRLLDLGRQRADARLQALAAVTQGSTAPPPPPS